MRLHAHAEGTAVHLTVAARSLQWFRAHARSVATAAKLGCAGSRGRACADRPGRLLAAAACAACAASDSDGEGREPRETHGGGCKRSGGRAGRAARPERALAIHVDDARVAGGAAAQE